MQTNSTHTMPRPLSSTGSSTGITDPLMFLKSAFAVATYLTTLLVIISMHKLLTWRGEKLILTASRFAAGIFLGTAMLELLSESDVLFHIMRYPVVFLVWCAGYLVAMLVDFILARIVRRLGRVCFRKSHPKFIDKMMLNLVRDLRPFKCCDATLAVGTTKPDPKDCDGMGYLQYPIIDRAIQIIDGIFLYFIFGILYEMGGLDIGSANTDTEALNAFLRATMQNILYTVSLTTMLLRFHPRITFLQLLFPSVIFSLLTPAGMIHYFFPNLSFTSPANNGSTEHTNDYWLGAILTGFCSGYLVYLAVHHLLITGGYELKKLVAETRFGKVAVVVCGVGLVAVVKLLDV